MFNVCRGLITHDLIVGSLGVGNIF